MFDLDAARQSVVVADPITSRHLQVHREPPHIPNLKIPAFRIQNLIQPPRRILRPRLIPPRRPLSLSLPPVAAALPSVQQPILLRKRGVLRRNRIHIPARDPADQHARLLLQHARNHAHLLHAQRHAHRQRLEVRVDHPQDVAPAHRYVRHERIPLHPALLEVDAHRLRERRMDQCDRPIPRAPWPARLGATRHNPEPLLDPRMCE